MRCSRRPVYRRVERVHYIVCSEDIVIISLEHRGDVLAFSAHSADLLYSVFDIDIDIILEIYFFQLRKVENCKKHIFDVGIQLDIGPNHVLAVSGELHIFSKSVR